MTLQLNPSEFCQDIEKCMDAVLGSLPNAGRVANRGSRRAKDVSNLYKDRFSR